MSRSSSRVSPGARQYRPREAASRAPAGQPQTGFRLSRAGLGKGPVGAEGRVGLGEGAAVLTASGFQEQIHKQKLFRRIDEPLGSVRDDKEVMRAHAPKIDGTPYVVSTCRSTSRSKEQCCTATFISDDAHQRANIWLDRWRGCCGKILTQSDAQRTC